MLLHSMLVLPRTFIAGPIVIWLWDRHLTRRLVQLISAFAYGVPIHEFAGAMIIATNGIGRPDYFEEQVYDATRTLAETALLSPESPSRRIARYSFLWDSSELERRKQSSILWRNLAPLTPDISKRYRLYPSVSRSELEGRLAQTSIMLEERMRELIGTVELIHSSYYSNPGIVLRISDFIADAHESGLKSQSPGDIYSASAEPRPVGSPRE